MSRRIAAVFGVDQYAMPDNDLRYAVADAEAMAAALSSPPYDFEVHKFLDEEASRRNILRTLTLLRESPRDLVVFFFAGHGVTTETGTYLVTADAQFADDGVELSALARALDAQASPDTRTLALLDCCHSGAAGPRALTARSMKIGDVTRAITNFSGTRAYMAACLPDKPSWEDPDVGHGIFTKYLLEGLAGRAADSEGRLTVAGLYQYVSRPFEADTRQTPVLRGDLYGDLVLASGLTPGGSDGGTSSETRLGILQRASGLLDGYTLLPRTDREEWLTHGYQNLCRALEPVILWFDKELNRRAKALASDTEFMSLYHSAWAEAGHLAHLTPGLQLREGTVGELLGAGTFGAVWRVATHAGTKAAYKVYNPTELRNHEKLTRFRQGYEAMGRLNHPYIVQVHSFTACPLGFYMDLIDGINLREQGPPAEDPSEVIVLLLAVADALRHAHGHDVIHRDIKPENIIMKYSAEKGRYEPFVTDFDLAWFSTATQLTNQAIGAMSYAAPEQLTPRLAETARRPAVDVYSFGQLAYFCVVDAHPVPLDYAGNQNRLVGALRSWGDPTAARAFLDFYKKCNQPDPETRVQTIQECRDALIAVGESLQSVAHDTPLSVEQLLDSIAYGLSGSTSRTIESPSGRTELHLSVQATAKPVVGKANLSVRVRPRQGFNRAGKSMNARRTEVNRQLDATLKSFPWADRSSGNDPGFEVFITMRQVDLKHSSSVACRNALDRVVEVMER